MKRQVNVYDGTNCSLVLLFLIVIFTILTQVATFSLYPIICILSVAELYISLSVYLITNIELKSSKICYKLAKLFAIRFIIKREFTTKTLRIYNLATLTNFIITLLVMPYFIAHL